MKNTITLSLIASAFLSLSAHASVLTPNLAKEFDSNVQLSVSATENVTGANKTLTMAGEGLRKKKKDLINWNVYVAQFYAEKPDQLVRTQEGALASLENVGTKALRLTFLRNVDIMDITDSFIAGLNANLISTTDQNNYAADVSAFIKMVNSGSNAINDASMTLFSTVDADGNEVLIYEDCRGTSNSIKSITKGFVSKVFSIWFGNSAPRDQGLFNLHAWLLNVPKVTPAQ